MSTFIKSPASASSSDEDVELRRGPWTGEEDELLIHYIASHGEGRWNLLAKRSGLRRTGKSCRLRWLNYLKPDVKRGNLTPQEQLLILELHFKWGNRWSRIAQHLPGRTDNEIKNYWRTRVQKQARHLKIDSNSAAFQEVIRCFWMPRLVQKIQGCSSSSSSSSSDVSPQNSISQLLNHVDENSPVDAQIPSQSPLDHMSSTMYTVDQQLKNFTSPSVSSSEPMVVPQVVPASPFHDMSNCCSADYNTLLKGCYNVDSVSYEMGNFSLGELGNPMCESHWIDNELENSFWNIDEFWQFRQLQERS